ncbi:TPA: AAA family ATPase [Klebsiella variicola]|uniref:ATP-dependent nuclease n=1 Tax=Klebsiella TaxID=570 RepID=UPI001CCB2EBA|nr:MULTISPECIES: AAA family ATPase [Klebsiella]HCI4545535.1 AAA family ATPase [Klebsiella quasipneumoniae subsp. quasipneumoniae]MBZ7450612.1 ATP-binding protein [Klebsiella michiganensis]MDE4751629.1 AAA family ATPase [Klebsiella pneumoniae]WRP36684.1 AAA family ATPase [Klebsiella variicola]HBR4686295.1 AAA family ATPase [Klebsiella pneumoniae]
MKLIKQVEIAYFRSIYKDDLNNCSGTNIIFGRNDAGKSNVLRALNLFFRNETNPNQAFRFERDFSHARRSEATPENDIRKFVYVKIWFTTPINWRASLGDSFWVKKQWSITNQEEPKFYSSITQPNLQQYLTRFLNKIQFHYIPAIKDRKIFEGLQAEIYKVISEHAEFSGSLTNFTEALRNRTQELTQGLLTSLKINSSVSTPRDLTDLFKSLDFEVTSEEGDSYSLTLQRGDGIQVRHIPQILSFLSDNSSKEYHIWGFEEPENSLELANAIEEAKVFLELGKAKNKQIFLTSHSPAFFSLKDDGVSKYFVSKTHQHMGRLNSVVKELSKDSTQLPSELMGETPHLPVISSYLEQAHAEIEKSKELSASLEQKLLQHNASIVFVEGATDAAVFAKAWELFVGGEMPFTFESGGGTTKMEALARNGKIIRTLAPGRAVFALVDNDKEGRELYKNKKLGDGAVWIQDNSNKVYWCRLPFINELRQLMTDCRVEKSFWPGCLENIFSAEVKHRASEAGFLTVTKTPHNEFFPDNFGKIVDYINERDDYLHYHILTLIPESKDTFAEWVVQQADQEPELLEPLRHTIMGLRDKLNSIAEVEAQPEEVMPAEEQANPIP